MHERTIVELSADLAPVMFSRIVGKGRLYIGPQEVKPLEKVIDRIRQLHPHTFGELLDDNSSTARDSQNEGVTDRIQPLHMKIQHQYVYTHHAKYH